LILRRLRGEPVVVPQEEADTVAPASPTVDTTGGGGVPDSVGPAPKDSAAAPVPKPDTAAAKPPGLPPPPL
jgi:hypothetical protein